MPRCSYKEVVASMQPQRESWSRRKYIEPTPSVWLHQGNNLVLDESSQPLQCRSLRQQSCLTASRQQARCCSIEATIPLWLHRANSLVEPITSLWMHQGNNLVVDASGQQPFCFCIKAFISLWLHRCINHIVAKSRQKSHCG